MNASTHTTTASKINLDQYESALTCQEIICAFGVPQNGKRTIKSPINPEEKNPSAYIYEDHIYDFSADKYISRLPLVNWGLNGNLQYPRGEDLWASLNWIADRAGLPRPARSPEAQALHESRISIYETLDRTWEDARKNPEPGIDYLVKRGISEELAKEYAGFLPKKYEPPDREAAKKGGLYSTHGNFLFRGRCTIPIRHQGRLIGFYGRALNSNTIPKHIYCAQTDPPMPQTVWGLDTIKDQSHLYLVEAIIDCLSMWTQGIRNCVAAFGTMGLTRERIRLLRNRGFKKIVMAYDTDGGAENE